ncbi:ATP-binding cassette domain-containing protein [Anaerocolumna sedimenticola]|uniref:ATP-binding cassette domain-containing protein n=1 Tax=Anaerocolumna sedimenticola TaxID=2696063 RepID=A0A6P1TI61_9FIRM|nr:ABC transporter ATP-binding protein [Anaerocolumna sedimenticola]QHQ59987.1 ATP-binding cassette domain-containing protein [Anaerocolumna sedimenticola]
MAEDLLKIEGLYKHFLVDKKKVEILKNINLTIREGEFITIVGHSGCGKSTLLKIIAGLVDYEIGSVTNNGTKISGPDIDRGMVFQEHRLLPWLSIQDNISFGLTNVSKQEKNRIVTDIINLVKLDGFENAYPHQLSGGMAQRAAIARGLVTNPRILLLDEPFGALDALTRIQMQKEILKIWEKEKTTMILVTHDIDEAVYLGQRIVVMSARPGEIKSIIDVDTAGSKIRGSADFAYLTNKVYQYFFEDEKQELEYSI